MHALLRFATAASRRTFAWVLRALGLVVAVCLALALGFSLYAVNVLPDLQPWHTTRLTQEFDARRHADLDFAGYLALERALFDEAAAVAATWRDHGEAFEHSRFNVHGAMHRLADGAPFNRSYRLSPPSPVGGALLVHGLSDSPYSVRALADALHRRGFEVTVLRLPGHGTFPSMMTEMHVRDWEAAVALAARDVARRTPADAPYYVGGYSTGATLVLSHALQALQDPSLRVPARVLLMSPAIQLTPAAALASVIDFFSVVPLPVLQKVRWQEVGAEYDPYKFNSFPVNASRQVNRATRSLQAALDAAERDGRLARLPPVVTWQSVVDATVGAAPTVDRLYARLNGAQHSLVLFDVNRDGRLASVRRTAPSELIERLRRGERRYTLELVSNASPDTEEVTLHRMPPGRGADARPTGLAWPTGIVSLGHVALPFPPDDPVYGIRPGSGRAGVPSLGSLLLRGEPGALTLSLGSLTRVRSNPFWPLIEEQVDALISADIGKPGVTPSTAAR